MKRIVVLFITIFIISATLYLNVSSDDNRDEASLSRHSSISNYFKSGIFIQDIGDLVIIGQKPNDATVIINKNDLDDIIAFLNSTNSSEE